MSKKENTTDPTGTPGSPTGTPGSPTGTSEPPTGVTIPPEMVEGKVTSENPSDLDWDVNKKYDKTVSRIVNIAGEYLDYQSFNKRRLRKIFTVFFVILLSVQYASVIGLAMVHTLLNTLSDSFVITYISSVFVETLSAIVIMIKFAFAAQDEVSIIKLLTAIVDKYQYLAGNRKNVSGK